MIMKEEDHLAHYGILRKSGRYPWGSGDNESAINRSFLDTISSFKAKGYTESQIAKNFGITRHELTAARTIALAQQKQERIITAERLKDKGMSNSAIGRQMGLNESSVRNLLAPGVKDKAGSLDATTNMLKDQVDKKGMVDVGVGIELYVGVTKNKLDTAIAVLREKGYGLYTIYIPQIHNPNVNTTMKVLAAPGITNQEVNRNRAQIQHITEYSHDGGRSYEGISTPLNVSSRRIAINYKEDGGAESDGVIYVRPGVSDLSLGSKRYAQVRIAVDGTHYLKGMAVYKDDLPEGKDLVFNTNKSHEDSPRKKDVMKELSDDPELPFGSIVRQIKDKGKVTSAMNIVNDEGSWDKWSRTLSSQMLSKQNPKLVQQQLDITFTNRAKELAEIQSLTNPTIRKELLIKFADATDSAASHLKAANMPRQATKVLLPINSIKPDQAYVPSMNDGERVVLVRFPHGGTFEMPELTVNNKNREARSILGPQAMDAIGIHHTVAQRLSGADFDGDTVLVIPNDKRQVEWTPALEGLKNFDPQKYKIPEGSPIPRISPIRKQKEMGKVSNLITDMTIGGANNEEKARAIRHSMVVIDAEKHNLDFKQSEKDNGIRQLKEKYQAQVTPTGRKGTGAKTLISRAGADTRVNTRRARPARYGGPIDPDTGKKMYEETGKMRPETKFVKDPRTGKKRRVETGKMIPTTQVVKRLANTDDAFDLSSGTQIETIYATHSNKLKAMANEARKESLHTKDAPAIPSSKKAYANEVESLNSKLNVALKNAPLERQAQLFAQANISARRHANPHIEPEDVKKIRQQELNTARARTGAGKHKVDITSAEWTAIQAGALSPDKLKKILANSDVDKIKAHAMPKDAPKMTSAKLLRAQSMIAAGYTQAEIANALGVGLTTLKVSLSE